METKTYLDIQTLHGYLGYSNKVLGDIVWPPFIPTKFKSMRFPTRSISLFITWGCRARTLRGRRLLANTMMLSKLWHYTAVIHIPEDTVAKWQSMVYKFILTRKRHKQDKHMSLINSAWRIIPAWVSGFRILHQEFVLNAFSDFNFFFRPTTKNHRYGLFSRSNSFEGAWSRSQDTRRGTASCIIPTTTRITCDLKCSHCLWRKIWDIWHRIPLTRKCPETPTQSQLLTMSIWLQVHPLFLVPGSNGPTSLAVALKHHRPFYKFTAQEGLHCLDDFVTAQRVWPSYEEFKLQMESHVWRFPGDDFPRVFRHLYSLLSLIATNVWQVLGISLEEAVPPNREVQFPVGQVWKNVFVPFQQWPRKYIRSICFCAPLLTKQHPMSSDSRNNDLAIKKYINTTVKPFDAISNSSSSRCVVANLVSDATSQLSLLFPSRHQP
ncbi:hypothetical protein Ae201684P_009143 [Aphanomyces euteiches]|nr:hypothetical protein Ae201684P_009143 [Aphanomyces euteiches]